MAPTTPDLSPSMEAIHAAYGKAILSTHFLERQLAFLIAAWDCLKHQKDEYAFARMMPSLHRKTMGDLIKAGIANGALSGELLEALKPAHELRNQLVHRISDFLSFQLVTRLGPIDVYEDLMTISENFKGMAEEVLKMAHFCCEANGFPLEAAYDHAIRVIEKAAALDRLTLREIST